MAIQVDLLAQALSSSLAAYAEKSTEQIKRCAQEVAQDCAEEIRRTAPVQSGSYQKGWKVKKVRDTATEFAYTVHNTSDYQLTNLLEHGHAKRNGGRVAAIPHIAPAEREAIALLEQKIKEALST